MHDMVPVLIGGSNPRGPKKLSGILAGCPGVLGFGSELRFLTDPGGLLDLVEALSQNWTPFSIDSAFRRFYRLSLEMSRPPKRSVAVQAASDLLRITPPRYQKFVIDRVLGLPTGGFLEAVKWLFQQMDVRPYPGFWIGSEGFRRKSSRLGRGVSHVNFVPRMSPREARALAREFMERLLVIPGEARRAHYWVDGTPENAQRAVALDAVFPNAVFLYVDPPPLSAVAALKRSESGPSDVMTAALWVRSCLESWAAVEEIIPAERRLKIRLDELEEDPRRVLNLVSRITGIVFPTTLDIDVSAGKSSRDAETLSEGEREIAATILGAYLNRA